MRSVYNWKPCFLIWGVHALLGAVVWQWDSLQWLGPASAHFRAALLAGQPIHSGNQKQGLRKWVLSEVTSQWGSTCFRSGKARTRTLGLRECAESWRIPRALMVGASPCVKFKVPRGHGRVGSLCVCVRAIFFEKVKTLKVGGQEGFGCCCWWEAA